MSEKIIGYILIVVGTGAILLSVFSVYSVFTKKTKPVQLFNFQGISLDTSQIISGNLPPEIARPSPPQSKKSSKSELIPPNVLNDSSNIIAHLMLMGFIVNVGFKLTSLGVNLVRPIVVKTKAKVQT